MPPFLAEAVNLSLMTPAQAWAMEVEQLVNPWGAYPPQLQPLAAMLALLHQPVTTPIQ
jgi:hypothetical protein